MKQQPWCDRTSPAIVGSGAVLRVRVEISLYSDACHPTTHTRMLSTAGWVVDALATAVYALAVPIHRSESCFQHRDGRQAEGTIFLRYSVVHCTRSATGKGEAIYGGISVGDRKLVLLEDHPVGVLY